MGNDLHVTGIRPSYLEKKGSLIGTVFCFVLVFLHYFYYYCLNLLFNVVLVRVCNYGQVKK